VLPERANQLYIVPRAVRKVGEILRIIHKQRDTRGGAGDDDDDGDASFTTRVSRAIGRGNSPRVLRALARRLIE
jgi:hypothetical protein